MDYIRATDLIAKLEAKLAAKGKLTVKEHAKLEAARVWLYNFRAERAMDSALFVKHVRG